MEPKWIRACDVIVFNFLRQNNFGEVAEDFRVLRKIPISKAEAFSHLKLEKISNFVRTRTSKAKANQVRLKIAQQRLSLNIGNDTREGVGDSTELKLHRLDPELKSAEMFLANEKSATEISAKVVRDYLGKDGAFKSVLRDFRTKLEIPPGQAPVTLEQLVQLKVPEKSYDDWSRIGSGFQELVGLLNPDDTTSEVDKVVKFILDKNILVRHINLQYSDFTNVNAQYFTDMKLLRLKCPGRVTLNLLQTIASTLIVWLFAGLLTLRTP